jgi:hypothetical protein
MFLSSSKSRSEAKIWICKIYGLSKRWVGSERERKAHMRERERERERERWVGRLESKWRTAIEMKMFETLRAKAK